MAVKVVPRRELTFWVKLYVPQILCGLKITFKHFFRNLIDAPTPPKVTRDVLFQLLEPFQHYCIAPVPPRRHSKLELPLWGQRGICCCAMIA